MAVATRHACARSARTRICWSSTTSTICSPCSASNARRSRLPDATARWRLFVAAPLPEDAAARAWEQLATVRAAHPNVKWLPPEKLHLTLVFLGPTDSTAVPGLIDTLGRLAPQRDPFPVATGDAGGRVHDGRSGVAWLRIADGGRDVADLALAVDDALGRHAYDANNAPRPHLTLARGVTQDALAALRERAKSLTLEWTVDSIALFRSHTDPGSSRYETLASARL